MGYGPEDIAEMRNAQLRKDRRQLHENRLRAEGLDTESVESMSASELESAIKRVDGLVRDYERLRRQASAEPRNRDGRLLPNSFLTLAYERKEAILERLRTIQSNAQLEEINRIAGDVTQVPVRSALESSIRKLQEQNSEFEKRLLEVSHDRGQAAERAAGAAIERYERRAKVWLSFLERESVASIMGAVVLLALTATVIVALFVGKVTPELLNNAFLIVIGYFFGQSTVRRSNE